MMQEKNKNELDFTGVPLELLKKMRNVESVKLNQTLIDISKKDIFGFYPNKFDLVLTQTNPESQRIIFEALDGSMIANKHCFDYLLMYTDRPDKQRRVLIYSHYPNILYEENFMISMLGINDEYVEKQLLNCFSNNLINNTHDFFHYKGKYERLSNFNKSAKRLLRTE